MAISLQTAAEHPNKTLHYRFIRREIHALGKQAVLFTICVALAMISLVAEHGLSESVNKVMRQDARSLAAADILLKSNLPFSKAVLESIDKLQRDYNVEVARTYTFYSMVRPVDGEESVLTHIKAVEALYPFYGKVELLSGRPFAEVLQPGYIIVEQSLLDRLQLAIGDKLRIGRTTAVIADVVVREPDRPVDFFALGPRLFAAAEDLPAMDLIQKGSRIRHTMLLKIENEAQIATVAKALQEPTDREQVRLETYDSAQSRVQRFLDNFLFFLSLIAVFTMLLAGIGIQSTVTALLLNRSKAIATLKTLGAGYRYILANYFIILLGIGCIGSIAGVILGVVLQKTLLVLAADILPAGITFSLSWEALIKAFLLGFVIIGVFTFLPLTRLRDIKPAVIFAEAQVTPSSKRLYILPTLLIVSFFLIMVFRSVQDVRTGVYFFLGSLALLAASAILTHTILSIYKKTRFRSLLLRQAFRGLFRRSSATRAIIITLSASTSLIFSIFLVEQNLDHAFISSFPEDAPNVYFIDIQPNQLQDFKNSLGRTSRYYPIVRARVTAINGTAIDRKKERQRKGDNLARPFSLTYRKSLLEDEKLLHGTSLFRQDISGPQVSVLQYVAKPAGIKTGDTITFNIQGLPLQATVASIRSRTEKPMRPFFVFVFPDETLAKAPQTIFTGIRTSTDEKSEIQRSISSRFPNVSVIDISETMAMVGEVMGKLSIIVRLFAFFSILAGLLLVISSILATRAIRIREAVYFKIVGAPKRFVVGFFNLENLILGCTSGVIALLLSQLASWLICTHQLDIAYQAMPMASLLMLCAVMTLTTAVGWFASLPIMRQKPGRFLQQEQE